MKRFVLVASVAAIVGLTSIAWAGVSITLGSVFPGWDKIRSGSVHAAATDLARGYARDVRHSCTMPEVFVRDRASSIRSALIFYEPYLPRGSSEQVLLDRRDQRVAMINHRTRDVLSVMVATSGGVVLILC